MNKKINWKLISDITVIISMTAILIGYTFLAIEIKKIKQDIEQIQIRESMQDFLNDKYEVDPKIEVR